MNDTLHVLNGDATLPGFEEAAMAGDILIWREVLSEGPLSRNIQSAAFWQHRSDWVCQTFDDSPENYNDSVLTQLEKLSEPYGEINLWFDFDLHCQVNLLGVMNMLNRQTNLSAPDVYLINPSADTEIENFAGIGQLNGEQLDDLYDDIRVQLSDYDFRLAAEAWELYVSGDAGALRAWLDATPFWANMTNLQPALEAHVARLSFDDQGLNYIHHRLCDIYNSGSRTRAEISQSFWKMEKIYGMGDAEIDLYLQTLSDKNLISLA